MRGSPTAASLWNLLTGEGDEVREAQDANGAMRVGWNLILQSRRTLARMEALL